MFALEFSILGTSVHFIQYFIDRNVVKTLVKVDLFHMYIDDKPKLISQIITRCGQSAFL